MTCPTCGNPQYDAAAVAWSADGFLLAGGQRLRLHPRALEVAKRLARAKGFVVSRAQLVEAVWGVEVGDRTVDTTVCRLRDALPDRNLVQAVRDYGYVWNGPALARRSALMGVAG